MKALSAFGLFVQRPETARSGPETGPKAAMRTALKEQEKRPVNKMFSFLLPAVS
jgi:hypothetical protein